MEWNVPPKMDTIAMYKNVVLPILFTCAIEGLFSGACKTHLGSSRYYDDNNPKKVYHLRLNPPVGSQYAYTVSRSTEFEMEVDGKKVDNKNRAKMDVTYTIGKDSSGDILLNIVYNKIHLYTKNGDTEEEEDADKAEDESADPVEKALGDDRSQGFSLYDRCEETGGVDRYDRKDTEGGWPFEGDA